MRRHALRPSALLAAAATLVMLSACSGGGDGGSAEPADDSTAQVSASEWYSENCAPFVSSLTGAKSAAYVLTKGEVVAPEPLDDDQDAFRLYDYDEASATMTPIRTVEKGETFCMDTDIEPVDAFSEPLNDDRSFAQVTSPEHPEGVWIDTVPNEVPLDETGAPSFEGAYYKAETYWTVASSPVNEEVLSNAQGERGWCDLEIASNTCGG